MNYSEMVLDRNLQNSTLETEGPNRMSDSTLGTRNTHNQAIISWVERMAHICQPEQVFWCDGSVQEKDFLIRLAVEQGILVPLDPEKWPGCYYHRSEVNDVARVEQCTYICTPSADEAGPTNNWAAPADMYSKLYGLAEGSDARPANVRGSLFNGPSRVEPGQSRDRAYRFDIRRSEYASHDAHGRDRLSSARRK